MTFSTLVLQVSLITELIFVGVSPPELMIYMKLISNIIHFQVEVLCIVMPRGKMVGYQRFGEPTCFHLQSETNGTRKGPYI